MEPRPGLAAKGRRVPGDPKRRWPAALLLSGALHIFVMAQTLSLEAVGPKAAAVPLATIEFVRLEPEARAAVQTAVRAEPSDLGSSVDHARAEARPTRAPRTTPTPRPRTTPTPSPVAAGPSPLSLLGLRPQVGALPTPSPTPAQARDEPLALLDRGALDASTLEGPAASPRGEGPVAPANVDDPMRGIVELADGSLGYTDPAGMFNAFINDDGSVRFQDSKSLRVKACVAFVCVGGGQVKRLEGGGKTPRSTLGVDFQLVPIGLAGVFGRNLGLNRREAEFLQRTAGVRIAMTARWQRRQIIKQLNALRAQLDELWNDKGIQAPERKRIYRELWEDCDVGSARDEGANWEMLPRSLHKARTDAAKSARKVIAQHYQAHAGEPLF